MAIAGITFKTNGASAHEILGHLSSCDSSFVPPLSERANLVNYSKKIIENAVTYEAWSGDTLAGLIAAYFNDREKHMGYITNVSVLPEFAGKGLGSELLVKCISHAMKEQYHEIQLEVHRSNARAISLYKKHNFIVMGERDNDIIMKWKNDGSRCVADQSGELGTVRPSREKSWHHDAERKSLNHE